jgi:hypothetical protein
MGGAAVTIIDCQHLGRAFRLTSGEVETSVISGVTIQNGRAIYAHVAKPTITDNIIINNRATEDGGGIYIYGATTCGLERHGRRREPRELRSVLSSDDNSAGFPGEKNGAFEVNPLQVRTTRTPYDRMCRGASFQKAGTHGVVSQSGTNNSTMTNERRRQSTAALLSVSLM